ncbi:MAG: transposase [Ignavibacteriae bacterium]|nr:transposase [Ignavibacteria bacterium]MBI3363627.1 transposase [Ignavibacteriota bacterium]
MSRRNIQFTAGQYYHLYNRGCNRELIFKEDTNYRFLLRLIKTHVKSFGVSVIAYCLMPNHYHFLLRQEGDRSLNKFMQRVFNSYTKAFNKKYHRSGTLFEERFRAKLIKNHADLIHLCRYIHRNPLDAGIVRSLEDWEYSNYLEWVGKRRGTLVDQDFVRLHFAGPDEYGQFVLEYSRPKKQTAQLSRYLFD